MRKTNNAARDLLAQLLTVVFVLTAPAIAEPPQPVDDDKIREMLALAGDADAYDGASLVYVLDEADVYVQHSGLATTESCQVIKILTDAGIRSQSVFRQTCDPDTNRIAVRSVKIHRADGVVEDVPLSGIVMQPTRQNAIYWGGDQYLLSIPRLAIGDALEIRTSKIGFNIAYLADGSASQLDASGLEPPMPGHWYEVTPFYTSHPIIHKRYTVHMPADMPIQYEVYNGEVKSSLWFAGDTHVHTFSAENIQPVSGEPHMVARDDCLPKLVIATVPDWEMKSRWFFNANESQFDADDAIRAKVAEITAGLDEEAQIQACLHWVADNIRYYGTSRGPREGFTLHHSIETFQDKGGVCKDIAGMLITMLRVLGHETYPSLTMAGSRVERIPADQFNHTVTVVRNPDGSFRVLDPTWSPVSRELWSSREALQGLVYGTPEGQDQTLSPYFSPEENMLQLHARRSMIDSAGTLTTDIHGELCGYPGTYLRRYTNADRKFEYGARIARYLNMGPSARIDKLDFIDPRDYSQNAWFDMTVSAPRYAVCGDDRMMFRLPLMRHPLRRIFIRDLFYGFSADEREFNLRLRATRLIRYEETIDLPDGWRVESAPEARSFESPSASISFEIVPGDGELSYMFEFILKDDRIAPENYVGFKKAVDMMLDIADEWVICDTD
ncbi:MAG: DUF3857 and transglutaminase domain-containing protein [Phycisphaerales bacterium]|nr:DUF3857 and transglutaminase domain-containing protein [Phycisphaerales bacterium]